MGLRPKNNRVNSNILYYSVFVESVKNLTLDLQNAGAVELKEQDFTVETPLRCQKTEYSIYMNVIEHYLRP